MDVKPLDKWDKHPNGMLKTPPVTGLAAMPLTSGDVAIRIEYAEDPAHLAAIIAGNRPTSYAQVGATLEQLDRLIAVLQNAAATIRAQMSAAGKRN